MKKGKRAVAFLLAAGIFLSPLTMQASAFFPLNQEKMSEEEAADRPYFLNGNNMSGIMIQTRNNLDYPSPESNYLTMSRNARKVVSDAIRLGADTLFYQAAPNMQAMYQSRNLPRSPYLSPEQSMTMRDPLKALIKAADAEGLSVCAVISPFDLGSPAYSETSYTLAHEHPDWIIQKNNQLYLNPHLPQVQKFIGRVCRELISGYRLRGILLDFSDSISSGLASPEDVQSILELMDEQSFTRSDFNKVGIVFPGDFLGEDRSSPQHQFLEKIFRKSLVDFIIPKIPEKIAPDNNYTQIMMRWRKFIDNFPRVEIFGFQDASRIMAPLSEQTYYSDSREVLFQQFANEVNGVSGSVINSLHDILLSPELASSLTTPQNPSSWYSDPALIMPEGLILGTPYESSSVTEDDSVIISGICNPQEPLYINSKVYDGSYGEISSTGHFSLKLPLQYGINHFIFKQGETILSKEVFRSNANDCLLCKPINRIEPSSAYPQDTVPLYIDDTLTLRCTAPAGAKIIASLDNGSRYPMTQEDPHIPQGIPAEYSVKVDIVENGYKDYRISQIGSVTYSMIYRGEVTNQRSNGEIYFVGSEESLAVQINDPLAFVYKNPSEQEIFYTLPQGTKDYVEKIENEHFWLESGGCVRKSAVQVLTSKTDIYTMYKKIPHVVIQSTNQGEYITLVGASSLPCSVSHDPRRGIVTLTLHHIREFPHKLNYLTSEMFKTIEVHSGPVPDSIQLVMKLREDVPFYGYQVSFNEKNTIVYFRSRFEVDKDPKTQQPPYNEPLKGLNIVVDAAHGGSDVGHPGILGQTTPNESSLNLAMANAVADRLRSMGANVFLTRSDHSAMAGVDRIMFSQYREADFLLSLHHLAGKSGVRVNCNNASSLDAAQKIADGLCQYLNQEMLEESALCKTYLGGVTMAPAWSVYLGDIMNPEDYADLCDPVNIYRTAVKIADLFSQEIQKLL